MNDLNTFFANNQLLCIVGGGFLLVWLLFPGIFKKMDKGRAPTKPAREFVDMAVNLGIDRASERLADAIGEGIAGVAGDFMSKALQKSAAVPTTPPPPTHAGTATAPATTPTA